jgi:transposase-like protein
MVNKQTIIDLFNAGWKTMAIVRELKVNRKLVYRTISRFKKTGNIDRKAGSGLLS